MKSSSHVFTDRLFMLFSRLGGRVLALLFHTLLRLHGFLFWLFLTTFRSRQTLPALHAERSGAICKIGAAIGTIFHTQHSFGQYSAFMPGFTTHWGTIRLYHSVFFVSSAQTLPFSLPFRETFCPFQKSRGQRKVSRCPQFIHIS